MKNLIISVGVALSLVWLSHAFTAIDFKLEDPQVNQHVSPAVSISTHVTGVTRSTNSVIISSSAVEIYKVVINTPGIGSKLEIFNTKFTTRGVSHLSFATIDTTTGTWAGPPPDKHYETILDSGCTINNTGSPAADVTITLRER